MKIRSGPSGGPGLSPRSGCRARREIGGPESHTLEPVNAQREGRCKLDEVSPTTDTRISLRKVTAETVRTVCSLSVAPDQRRLVASNAESIAEAYFTEEAWFRAVYADETPVGFVMLHDDPREPRYYLWRFMIAAEHQGKGYGRRAMGLLIEHVKTRPRAEELLLSYVPGEGSPEGFYRGLGFEPTGEENEGEIMVSLRLREG